MTKPSSTAEIVQRLRARGHRGGNIAQHRAIWRLPLPMGRVVAGCALALAFSTALMLLRPWVGMAWGDEVLWWLRALALRGQFVPGSADQVGWFGLVVPVVIPEMPVPDANTPLKHGAVLVLLWWCTGWLSDAAKPLAFFVRLGVLVHGASVLFFMFWSASFTHTVAGHVASGLRQTWYLMLATPWIHLMTYYLFPFAHWQRAALTAATLLFLFVLTPLQYALHVALASMSGLILLPLLNLMFGVMLPVVGVVALYGWGMAWAAPIHGERRAR
ncbi:hypothetical protein [Pseudorhodoferax sp. Leaf267]|uniref:hypothetical protein n=1 Tax=Pseudorhodoferax sp. Leaf267 TaxID=1736316 RepID=UPI0006FB4121|nr:hypothetical protein [Pseudorhodoferax sp. Leaf267]KQP13104.1 hypothetical protein ASF43_18495 [Pseudorhodoferax sp. Leaf267]